MKKQDKFSFGKVTCLFSIGLILLTFSTVCFAEKLHKVETKKVCMINNSIFPTDQIPTVVEGKTYYGCCPMCADKLRGNRALRMAIDPKSGKEIDKASAVIGADTEGKAYYFESENNLEAYQ